MHDQNDIINYQKTEVISDFKIIENKISQFINHSNNAIIACIDDSRPGMIVENLHLRELILNRKLNGVNLKVITEITKQNIHYCKELMSIVDEMRHLDGIKGTFYLSDTEYIALANLQEKGKPVEQIIYSNVKEIVEHQRYLFQTLWNKGLSAESKFREIQEGIMVPTFEIVNEPIHTQEQVIKMVTSAKEEMLGLFSTSDAFHRQESNGGIALVTKIAKERNIKVRVLTPMDNEIKKFFCDLKNQKINLDIKHIEENFVSILIVDRKFSLTANLRTIPKIRCMKQLEIPLIQTVYPLYYFMSLYLRVFGIRRYYMRILRKNWIKPKMRYQK